MTASSPSGWPLEVVWCCVGGVKSVGESLAGLLPAAGGAPHVAVLHPVHFTALLPLAAHLPTGEEHKNTTIHVCVLNITSNRDKQSLIKKNNKRIDVWTDLKECLKNDSQLYRTKFQLDICKIQSCVCCGKNFLLIKTC